METLYVAGLIIHGMVTSHIFMIKFKETIADLNQILALCILFVKEQRVDGSWCILHLRCTLLGLF